MVPMISGRGLGHTGGTLDKLEAIPGYNTTPASNDLIRIVNEVGCAIIGQTGQLAPADGRLYAIRDVTATVESTPLITASILSKKMAAGLKGLVMDVKWGSGAFMATRSDAKELAKNISQVATKGGMPTAAFITDMNQVLGHSAGNALEVLEAIEFLTGTRADPRLKELCTALVGEMLCLVDLAKTPEQGLEMAEETLTNGSAAEKFASMVAALNGPKDLITRPAKYLEAAPVIHAATAKQTGFVTKVDVRALGNSIVKLGGGRIHPAQKIDHRVGLSEVCPIGHEITTDQPLCLIHGADSDTAKAVADEISDAFQIAAHPPSPAPIIADRVGPFDT
jgi:thymidine phosphorylase